MGLVPHMRYVGSISNYSVYNSEFVPCPQALEYLALVGWNESMLSHRMVYANQEAGYLSLAKYGRKQPVIDKLVKSRATRMLAQAMIGLEGSRVIEDYETLTQMCVGKSSPGFPWTKRYPKKKDLFKDHSYELYWKDWHAQRQAGNYRPVVFVNKVKSELKSVDKKLANSVRTYTAGPVHLTMEGYCYFADQNAKIIQEANALQTPIVAGYQKFNLGWDRLYRRLNRFPNAGMMDISAFDASCSFEMFQEVYKVRRTNLRRECDTESTQMGIDAYMRDIVCSYILCDGGEIIQKLTGNPSGQVNTITDNSLILVWAWFYAWSVLKPKDYDSTWEDFRANVELFVCGDDSIYTISDEVKSWFHPQSIQEVFENAFDWKFKIESPEFMLLDDTEFCSMHWVHQGGRVFPAPVAAKVLSSLVYKSKTESLRMTFLRACALRIESWYCKETRDILNDFCRYLVNNYENEMVHAPIKENDPFSFEIVKTSYLAPYEIEELYIGGENCNVSLRPIEFVVRENPAHFLSLSNEFPGKISVFDE